MKRRCIHPEFNSRYARGARGGVDVVGASEPVAPGASVPSGLHSYDYLCHSNVIGVINTRFEFLFHSEPVTNRQQLRCDRVKLEILVVLLILLLKADGRYFRPAQHSAMTSSAALASIKAPAAALRAPATVRRGRGRVTVAPIRAVSTAAEGSKLGAIVAEIAGAAGTCPPKRRSVRIQPSWPAPSVPRASRGRPRGSHRCQ